MITVAHMPAFPLRQISRQGARYFIMGLCGLVTLYIFASSYETTFNRSLPFVDAVSSVNIQPVSRFLQPYLANDQSAVGNYGKPQYMKLPAQDVRIILAPAIKVGGQFLARANTGHYALVTQPKNGNLGDALIYYRKSWRTNDQPERVKVGDNIFVDTDRGWRYFYRVDEVKIVDPSAIYITREAAANQLVVIAADGQANGQLPIAHALLVNVQNVQQ